MVGLVGGARGGGGPPWSGGRRRHTSNVTATGEPTGVKGKVQRADKGG